MSVWEIILIGVALSMDAVAVGMTNGMIEPKMRVFKMLLIAGAYGFFQFFMPVLGYYCGYAFSSFVEKIAPWLSFALLGFIGGKMIFDFVKNLVKSKKAKKEQIAEPTAEATAEIASEPAEATAEIALEPTAEAVAAPAAQGKKLGAGKLLLQALATSIDALAVGVTLLAAETTEGLPFHVTLCALLIGAATFILSFAAVFAGKKIGNRFADKAGLLGGMILVGIGLKILIEGLLG